MLSRLLATPRLRWPGADTDEHQADAREFFVELYRTHVLENNGRPSPALLARWLEIASRLGDTKLAPDPLSVAVEASAAAGSEVVAGAVAKWVWRLWRPREAAGPFLLARANRADSPRAILTHPCFVRHRRFALARRRLPPGASPGPGRLPCPHHGAPAGGEGIPRMSAMRILGSPPTGTRCPHTQWRSSLLRPRLGART